MSYYQQAKCFYLVAAVCVVVAYLAGTPLVPWPEFRWPVAYFATDPATAHQLYLQVWEVIQEVEERGFTVEYVMMDGSSANRSLTSMILGDNAREKKIATPYVYDFLKSITFVQDIKHCFKKIRNGIESSRLEHKTAEKGKFLLLQSHPVVWEHYESAFEFNTQSGLRIHRHLTKEYVHLTPSNKIRNNLATQVLDKDMLYLMRAYQASLRQPEQLSSTIKFLENTSILVDFFRSYPTSTAPSLDSFPCAIEFLLVGIF